MEFVILTMINSLVDKYKASVFLQMRILVAQVEKRTVCSFQWRKMNGAL